MTGEELFLGRFPSLALGRGDPLLYSPPWIAATEDDLLAKRGVKVGQIVGSEGGGTTMRNVVSGGLPIGEVATTAAITAYNAGADIKIVGGGVGSGEDVFWVTRPDAASTRSRTSRARRSATRARDR